MFTVAIIEDEPLALEDLAITLMKVSEDAEVVAKLDSVQSAVEWLQSHDVDLILSDIELGDGLSFEIFTQVKKDTPIIITTAYDQYAIRAFKENSIDYLLKPVDSEHLKAAIDKYRKLKADKQPFDMDSLLLALRPRFSGGFQERFMVTLGEKIHSIPETEVAYFFSEDRYTFLVTKTGVQHIINYNLGDLEETLNPKKFFRINRKFIIAYESIKGMIAYSKSRVKVDLVPTPPANMDVVVSVERSGAFKKWLNG